MADARWHSDGAMARAAEQPAPPAPRRRLWRGIATAALALIGLAAVPTPSAAAEAVDLQLVLAVDVSMSMDEEEQRLQRQGYAQALTAPDVLDAIGKGAYRSIAVAYVEWAGSADQLLLIDWRRIDGAASAKAWADDLLSRPYRRVYRTSISGGLMFSLPLFDKSPFQGERRVIDVSGDGANNQGMAVTLARDAVVAQGITINGLPILISRSYNSYFDVAELDAYYEDCVIGGENAFVVPIKTRDDFLPATRRKILMEVANRMPAPWEPRIIPAAGPTSSPMCEAGERMWNNRGNWPPN